jgi:hypothetical protein
MGQFSNDTRIWLKKVISQRKFLVKNNLNHKPEGEVLKAISELEIMLKIYTYEKDQHMARFIKQQLRNIEIIMPGSGATLNAKRLRELNELNKQAMLISSGRTAQDIQQNKKSKLNTREYEIEFL